MKYLIFLKADNRPARLDIFNSEMEAKTFTVGAASQLVYNINDHYIAEFDDNFDFTNLFNFDVYLYLDTTQDKNNLITNFSILEKKELKTAKQIYSDLLNYFGVDYVINTLRIHLTPFFDTCLRQESITGYTLAKDEIDRTSLSDNDKTDIKNIIDGII